MGAVPDPACILEVRPGRTCTCTLVGQNLQAPGELLPKEYTMQNPASPSFKYFKYLVRRSNRPCNAEHGSPVLPITPLQKSGLCGDITMLCSATAFTLIPFSPRSSGWCTGFAPSSLNHHNNSGLPVPRPTFLVPLYHPGSFSALLLIGRKHHKDILSHISFANVCGKRLWPRGPRSCPVVPKGRYHWNSGAG